mmetsp:Transcript_11255/g.20909  ORF Transcript_11255/g.20909 Transcript_11255/m.20909 type:complete len:851 (-) Transcript_11255:3138-5690(-)|eukprot:CAMPEP_0203743960 /NCGR_PEP_ID=MMETSP0098-20131031/195_1 /ASSEMBLY_ACC=CAM_ASM_000208 /TAXON_ID=96639 /ORGANISM=" , Strain NY0313808BC1" /LENGTH=850 /DNA_ID=CAMNT_0050631353 /DNA_START=631 /DNA_END=3183 /DNA_ORIENTATION=-
MSRLKHLRDVQQKRKAEAPFYLGIHQWLLVARHAQACAKHEKSLLFLQDELLAGRISKSEMQLKVRTLINGRKKEDDTDSIVQNGDAVDVKDSFWFHSVSFDGVWEAFSSFSGCAMELMLKKQFSNGKGLVATFRYSIQCLNPNDMRLFHFSILKRFTNEQNGLFDMSPIRGSAKLCHVSLRYAPAEADVQQRWDAVYRIVTEEQADIHEHLLRAVTKLQNLYRYGSISPPTPVCESSEKKKKKKKKRTKKKKSTNVAANSVASVSLISGSNLAESKDAVIEGIHQEEKGTIRKEKENVLPAEEISEPAKPLVPEPVQPLIEDTTRKAKAPPAQVDDITYHHNVSLLSHEVDDLVCHIQSMMKRKERANKELQWYLQTVLEKVFPCSKLFVFGSHACGFALPSSDLDVYYIHREDVCFGNTLHQDHLGYYMSSGCSILKSPIMEQLGLIQNALRNEPWVKTVKVIKAAGMPIARISTCLLALNGEAEDTHLNSADHLCPMCCMVDLSCGHSAGHSTMVSSNFLIEQSKVHPQFLPLMILLKQLLVERGLCNVFNGGLSSFSLSLLVLRYLQHINQFPSKSRAVLLTEKSGQTISSSSSVESDWHQRQLADWPSTERPPASYVQQRQKRKQKPLGKVSAANAGAPRIGSNPVFSEKAFDYYHRQLADWPSMDAAHHFEWMRTMMEQQKKEELEVTEGSEDVVEEDDHNEESDEATAALIGENFVGFLDFYGNRFNPADVGLTVIGNGAFYSLSKSSFSRSPQPITIDNPCWPNRNVAAASYGIGSVLETFREVHRTLYKALTEESDQQDMEAHPTFLRKILKVKWGQNSKRILEHALKKKQQPAQVYFYNK